MARTRLKICGVTNLADALGASRCGADMLGFNFYTRSPRYIEPVEARKIINQLPFYIQTVGILVKPSRKDMELIQNASGVNALQVYEAQGVRHFGEFSFPVIYAIRVGEKEKPYWPDNGASMMLIDTYSSTLYGGTGRRFDWSRIESSIPRDRLILAGGITIDNIVEAVQQVGPAVIDVASGAETEPGKKDLKKIAELAEAIISDTC